jgi:hypothetical protein
MRRLETACFIAMATLAGVTLTTSLTPQDTAVNSSPARHCDTGSSTLAP